MESVPEQPRLDEEHRVARNPLHGRKGSGALPMPPALRAPRGRDHVTDEACPTALRSRTQPAPEYVRMRSAVGACAGMGGCAQVHLQAATCVHPGKPQYLVNAAGGGTRPGISSERI